MKTKPKKHAKATSLRPRPVSVEARSMVAGRNLEPYTTVHIIFEDGTEEQVTQWTPEEALHHAFAVIQAVEASRSDAFMVAFVTERLGMPLENSGAVIAEFRLWRDRKRTPEPTQ